MTLTFPGSYYFEGRRCLGDTPETTPIAAGNSPGGATAERNPWVDMIPFSHWRPEDKYLPTRPPPRGHPASLAAMIGRLGFSMVMYEGVGHKGPDLILVLIFGNYLALTQRDRESERLTNC